MVLKKPYAAVREKNETGGGRMGRVDERRNNYSAVEGWQLRALK